MSTRDTGREHTQRDKGRSPRAKMERQVETRILSSSNPRVKVGGRCKLQHFDDGTTRLLLPEQMGMAATHGRKVACLAQDDGWNSETQQPEDIAHLSGVMDNGYSDYDYFIPWAAYTEARGETS